LTFDFWLLPASEINYAVSVRVHFAFQHQKGRRNEDETGQERETAHPQIHKQIRNIIRSTHACNWGLSSDRECQYVIISPTIQIKVVRVLSYSQTSTKILRHGSEHRLWD